MSKISSAFGFGPDETDVEIADDPMPDANVARKTPEDAHEDTVLRSPEETRASVDRIFEHVVRVFNSALPDFLKATVDESAQRRKLYEMLDGDLKAYLSRLREEIEREGRKRWDKEKLGLQANLREIEERNRTFDEQKRELTQKQLNAERQRKALAERVNTMQARLEQMEAEREQFELENKSLVNKVKVMEVYEKEAIELREAFKNAGEGKPVIVQDEAKIEELTKRLDALQHEYELQQVLLSEQTRGLDKAKAELREARAENEEAKVVLAGAAEIEKQIGRFEELKKSQDEKIKALEAELAEAKKLIEAREGNPEAMKGPRLIETEATPIEDILSGETDWPAVQPAQRRTSQKGKSRGDKRNDHPDNENQLSLF